MQTTDRTSALSWGDYAAYFLPPLVMSAWGVVMLHTWATGRTKMLLHPFFQPVIGISGLIIIALVIAHLCYFKPSKSKGASFRWLVLLLPLLFAAAYAPKSFSAQMIAARGIQSTAKALDPGVLDANAQHMLETLGETDPTQPLPMDIVDLVTASGVPALTQKLENRTLRLHGQFYRLNSSDFKIIRLLMYCCAADVTPIGVLVHGQSPADSASMSWMEIEGTVHFVQSLGQVHPEIDLLSVKKVPAPANPYAY